MSIEVTHIQQKTMHATHIQFPAFRHLNYVIWKHRDSKKAAILSRSIYLSTHVANTATHLYRLVR